MKTLHSRQSVSIGAAFTAHVVVGSELALIVENAIPTADMLFVRRIVPAAGWRIQRTDLWCEWLQYVGLQVPKGTARKRMEALVRTGNFPELGPADRRGGWDGWRLLPPEWAVPISRITRIFDGEADLYPPAYSPR